MLNIDLDASKWTTVDDVYSDLLPALKAPPWHGRNLDALDETVSEGNPRDDARPEKFTNGVRPPYHIHIRKISLSSEAVREFLPRLEEVFREANDQYGPNARMVLLSCYPH